MQEYNIQRTTYQELPGIGPSRPVKSFDSNPPLILQLSFINDIRGFLPMLRNNVLYRKARCSYPQLFNGIFTKCRQIANFTFFLIFCQINVDTIKTDFLIARKGIGNCTHKRESGKSFDTPAFCASWTGLFCSDIKQHEVSFEHPQPILRPPIRSKHN